MKRAQIITLLLGLFLIINLSTSAQENSSLSVENDSIAQTIPEEAKSKTLSERINDAFVPIVNGLSSVLFWDPFSAAGVYDSTVYDEEGNIAYDDSGNVITSPIRLVVVWLICGALFFTVFMRFINIRGFKHAIDIVRGRYDDPNHKGEVSHFQALTTALSATVGLGNIASVAIAIVIGGPGATFWMILAG
ncbi:MAG: hypothetical protein CL663_05875, partial [Bacteroidetes bacterium]|nr:hypothetical protein [Bacteroidota bacterium]